MHVKAVVQANIGRCKEAMMMCIHETFNVLRVLSRIIIIAAMLALPRLSFGEATLLWTHDTGG